jgi:hypothetical protein
MPSSGKLVILGIAVIALAAASASWWFRYSATHRAAEFWGPQTARLIRDAPRIEMYQITPPMAAMALARERAGVDRFMDAADSHDISATPGITHLRNALLEDGSYQWPPMSATPNVHWKWALIFSDVRPGPGVVLLFSPDWTFTMSLERPTEILSCQPIADGLAELLGGLAGGDNSPR